MADKYQWFNGKKFTRDDKTGYYLNSTIRERMHRYVWKYYNGDILKGYAIHHIDHDRSNNDISNLQLMEQSAHLSLHGKEADYNEQIKRMNHARISANIWHGSKAGHDWHKKHYEQMKEKLYKRYSRKCDYCGSTYEAVDNGKSRFCSNKCKSAYRRKMGLDNVVKKCKWCGKKFVTNKYYKTDCCCSLHGRKYKASSCKVG